MSLVSGPWAGYELSVTRALGHSLMANCGVIPDPYVTTINATDDDFCLVGLARGGGGGGRRHQWGCREGSRLG